VNHALYAGLARVLRPVVDALYRLEVAGAERIPRRGGCIVVANHESVIDPFVLGLASPRPLHFMAKAELWSNPLVARTMDAFGGFPVRRAAGDREATTNAAALLAAGEALAIFPQGTCLPYRRRPLGRGAAKLALATGAPLVPVCLIGTERAVRPHRLRVGFPDLLALVAPPIAVEPAHPTVRAARSLTDRIEHVLDELRRPYGPPAHAWID
jgi:1-acyl-sn-glycerol-3-phosphate acyltransferase